MTDFNSNMVFLIAVVSAVGGLWWRIEAAIKSAKSEAMTQASAASTAAALAMAQLAEYKYACRRNLHHEGRTSRVPRRGDDRRAGSEGQGFDPA